MTSVLKEVLAPWEALGGESLLHELGLWVPPDLLPAYWNPLLQFFHANVELTVTGASKTPPSQKTHQNMVKVDSSTWTPVLSDRSFLVTQVVKDHRLFRGPISSVLQGWPLFYGLEATHFLAYLLWCQRPPELTVQKPRPGKDENTKLVLDVSEDYKWSTSLGDTHLDLEEIPPIVQRALELGGMAYTHEDARTALGLEVIRSQKFQVRTFRIKSQEEMQRTGSWVEPAQKDETILARLQSRPLSRS